MREEEGNGRIEEWDGGRKGEGEKKDRSWKTVGGIIVYKRETVRGLR